MKHHIGIACDLHKITYQSKLVYLNKWLLYISNWEVNLMIKILIQAFQRTWPDVYFLLHKSESTNHKLAPMNLMLVIGQKSFVIKILNSLPVIARMPVWKVHQRTWMWHVSIKPLLKKNNASIQYTCRYKQNDRASFYRFSSPFSIIIMTIISIRILQQQKNPYKVCVPNFQ